MGAVSQGWCVRMYLRVPERGEHPERRSSHAVLAYQPCAHYQPTRQFVQVGKSIAILRQHPFRCLFLMLRPSGVPSTRDRGRMRAYTPSNTTAVFNTVDGWFARAHADCTRLRKLSARSLRDSMGFVANPRSTSLTLQRRRYGQERPP